LPRTLGEFEGNEVTIGMGKFGPYIKFGKSYVSFPKDEEPTEIELDRAIELILQKRKADAEKIIQSLDGEKHIDILNGRFGPYISCGGKNFKIPKGKKPDELSYAECEQIMAAQTTT
jgi:DNA topoisomerase-1